MTRQTILAVPWVVLEDATPAAPAAAERDLVTVCAQTVEPPAIADAPTVATPAPVIIADTYDTSAPWVKSLLTGALVLAAIWLAVLALIILDGALFADAVVRGAWAIGVIPIITMLAIAMLADPYRNVGDDIYQLFNPFGQCTPSRANTLTGRGDQ